MRKLAVGVSIMMLLLLVAAPAIGQDRPIVAVFDIEARGVRLPPDKINNMTDYLISLIAGRGFRVVPRSQLKQSLSKQKEKPFQKAFTAQIILLGAKCKVSLALYDVKSSINEKGIPVSGGCSEAEIVESLEKAVEQLIGGGTGQPPAPIPQPAPPAEKVGLTWVKSVPAGIEFTKSEITVAQYHACMEVGKCLVPGSKDDEKTCNWGYAERDNHPVNCVDWHQANAFCEWAGGRLPTEQEWYAEASNGDKRKYPWGDTDVTCDTAVWKDGCGKASTWPVCSKPAGNSVSGICDMSGNVWEWTSTAKGWTRIVSGGGGATTNLRTCKRRAGTRTAHRSTAAASAFGVGGRPGDCDCGF